MVFAAGTLHVAKTNFAGGILRHNERIPDLNGKSRIRALLKLQPLGQAAVGLSEMVDHLSSSDPSKILVNLIT